MGRPISSEPLAAELGSESGSMSPEHLTGRKSRARGDVRVLGAAVAIGLALGFPVDAHAVEKLTCVDAHARSQELRKAGRFRDSRAQLLICADESCPNLVRIDCADWLSQIEERVATVMIDARDATGSAVTAVRVILDGAKVLDNLDDPVIRLDSGQHQFHFEHDGSVPIDVNVSLREGEPRRTLPVKFAPPPPPGADEARRARSSNPGPPWAIGAPASAPPSGSFRSRAPIVTGAVAAAALGSLAYFGVRGLQAADRLRDECASSCAPARVAPVRTQLLVADISLATAVIMGGITAWLVWDNRRLTESDSIVSRTSATVDADSIRLQYSGRF